MPDDAYTPPLADPALLPDLTALTSAALPGAEAYLARALDRLRQMVCRNGRVVPELLDREQRAAHGVSWLATSVECLRQIQGWAGALLAQGTFGECEALLLQIGFGETLASIRGGIAMSQGELARPADLGLRADELDSAACRSLMAHGNSAAARARLVALIQTGQQGRDGLDADLTMIRDQFRRFSDARIAPFAHGWHLADQLIPMALIDELAALGTFGLTIPEEYGGLGLSKAAMAVVSEELSRGYIGTGSLGTRSEIAAELILAGGTEAQRRHWLPKLASGEILPTAVFTEPGTGSDLGALRTRAVREGADYRVTGNKTWITHAARAHLMTLLVRTDPASTDYRGLSMFLAEKTQGTEAVPFPDAGLTGGEIGVLGYRGMKEYELGFDGFAVAGENLLGGFEGQGFKQLMQTFESARIQTAARAVGVAQAALDEGLSYATARVQFGKPLIAFPRVADKLAMMAVELMMARQLTYHAARRKDGGQRCDLEAGMAKLYAARVAWAAADGAVQIHGGNGFALEFKASRLLCDARILNIFEGAAEIQAQVITRRLLE